MKEFLSHQGVPYVEKRVDQDRAAAIEMIRRSGQQGVPVTVIDGELVIGYDRPRLERILAARSSRPPRPSGRRSLGARVADAARFVLPGGQAVEGALVGGVKPDSPAEAAGLTAGDVIVALNGRPVPTSAALAEALERAGAGTVTLAVRRGPDTREVRVELW